MKRRLPITQADWRRIRSCVDMIAAGDWDEASYGPRPDLEKLLDKIDERIKGDEQ